MKQCRKHNCPLQDICRVVVDNSTWWNIGEDCEIFTFVKAQEQKIFALENRLKECENGYEGTCYLERTKLHDAEEKVKELTEENERLSAYNENLIKANTYFSNHLLDEVQQAKDLAISYTVKEMKERLIECFNNEVEHLSMYTEAQVIFAIDQIAKEMEEGV